MLSGFPNRTGGELQLVISRLLQYKACIGQVAAILPRGIDDLNKALIPIGVPVGSKQRQTRISSDLIGRRRQREVRNVRSNLCIAGSLLALVWDPLGDRFA